jgi:hypothetical protein
MSLVFHNMHVVTARVTYVMHKPIKINIVCGSIFGAEIEIVGVADPGTRNISLSM